MAIDLTKKENMQGLINAVETKGADWVNQQIKDQNKVYDAGSKSIIDIPTQQPKTQIQNQQVQTPKQTFEPIDTQTGQPVQQTTPKQDIVTPEVKPTEVKTEVKPTEVKGETPQLTDLKNIQTVEDWKKQTGGGLNNLESWIEQRYGTVATQQGDKLTAMIGDKKYEWSLDEAGNPRKVEIPAVQTQNDLFQTILAGGEVDKNNKFYKQAYNNVQKYKYFSGLDEGQLTKAMQDGLLLPGTTIYNELIKNSDIKTKIDKANALNLINGDKTDQTKTFENKSEEILNDTEVEIGGNKMTLGQAMSDGYISQDEYNQMTNNSEVMAKQKEVEDLKNKYDELQATYDAIRDETEASLKGTGATKSDLEALVGEKQKNMLGNLNLAISKYNNALGTLTQMKADATDLFVTNLGLYQKAEQRTYEEQQAQKALQQQFDYTYGDLTSPDQRIRTVAAERIAGAIQQQYAGMPFRRDVSTMGADILTALDSGQTIEQITTDITNAIQNAPAYEQWAISKGLKKETVAPEITTIGDKSYTFNKDTGKYEIFNLPTTGFEGFTGDYTTLDFSTTDLTTKYSNEASFKNNNPTGLTWGISNELKQMFDEAGISYIQGTARPNKEGGNYIKFASVQDGLDAYMISLTKRGDDVYQRLFDWSAGGNKDTPQAEKLANKKSYATGLMAKAGISKGTKFSQLTEDQLSALMDVHLKKESPNFYKELSGLETKQTTYNADRIPQYIDYIEKGKIPTGLKEGTPEYKNFIQEAKLGYSDSKNKAFEAKGFTIANPDAFANTSTKQKEDISLAINNVQPFIQSMNKVIELVQKYGTENPYSVGGKKINQEVRNAQLLAKEIYNLGVLNGPDLSLMESIIANPTSVGANITFWQDYVGLLESGKQTIIDNAISKAQSVGLDFIDYGNLQSKVNVTPDYSQYLPKK